MKHTRDESREVQGYCRQASWIRDAPDGLDGSVRPPDKPILKVLLQLVLARIYEGNITNTSILLAKLRATAHVHDLTYLYIIIIEEEHLPVLMALNIWK